MARLHDIFTIPELLLKVMEEVDNYDDLMSLIKSHRNFYSIFNAYQRNVAAHAMRQNFVAFDQALVAVRLTNRVMDAVRHGELPSKLFSLNTIDIRLGALGATTEEFKQMCALQSLCEAYLAQEGTSHHAIQKALTPFSKRFGGDFSIPTNYPRPGKELAHRSFYRLLITGAALYRDFNLPFIDAAQWGPVDFLNHCFTETRQFENREICPEDLNVTATSLSQAEPNAAAVARPDSSTSNELTPGDIAYLLQYQAYNPLAKAKELEDVYGRLNRWLKYDFKTCADWNKARSAQHEERTNKKACRDSSRLDFDQMGQLRELEAYILMQELFRRLRSDASRVPLCTSSRGEPGCDPSYRPSQDREDVVEKFLERKGKNMATRLVPTAIFPDDFRLEAFLIDRTQPRSKDTVQRVPYYLGKLGVALQLSTAAVSDILLKMRVEKRNMHRFMRQRGDEPAKLVPLAPLHLKVPELLLREQFGLQFHERMFSKTGLMQPWTDEFLKEAGSLFESGQFSSGLLKKQDSSLRYLQNVDDGEYQVRQMYDIPARRRKLPKEIIIIMDGKVRSRRKIEAD